MSINNRHDVSFDYCEMTLRNPPGLKDLLDTACVGIAGCGGLGSNIAMMLARAGVGKLVIVDDDKVVLSNLNRQHFFLSDIGKLKVDALECYMRDCRPDIQINKYSERITRDNVEAFFVDCDVVIEAFDGVADKAMILQAFGVEPLRSKPLVSASGLGGMHSANQIKSQVLTDNITICGDMEHEASEEQGVVAPRVQIVAGHQALIALRLLGGMKSV